MTETTAAANNTVPDEATVTKFWKLMTRIDDAGIVELLFTRKESDSNKDDTDSDDDVNHTDFYGRSKKMTANPFAKALVNTAREGTQPLLYAVQNSFEERTVIALIAAGAEVDAAREKGDKHTPLIAACWGEDDILAGALLKHGADITAVDGNGFNAFHVCATLGAHNLLGHLLANYVATSGQLVALLSAKEGNNGMTPMQIAVQELPTSLQQGDRRYIQTLEEMFQGMGIKVMDKFPQSLAANTRLNDDLQVIFEGENRKDKKKGSEDKKKAGAGSSDDVVEPTTGGKRVLKTEKNPDIFPTRAQARKIFEQKDATGNTIAHTISEVLGTVPQAQPLLRTVYASFAFATFDPAVHGSKLFTQQDADGNTPLHLMLQHAYLTTTPQAASVATAMVVTTITPAIRCAVASRGLPGNSLCLEQMRNLLVATRNNEGLSCLGLCAAIAEVPAAASLSAEILSLWVTILPNPLERRGLFGTDAEAYRAFLLGWAISKQNAATQVKEKDPEMAKTILNPDAERRINLDMNHCVAKIVGIPNILGTAETLSIFGGLPREAAMSLRNESIGRAAVLAEQATKAAAEEEAKRQAEEKANGGGCCGGAKSCGSGGGAAKKGGDFTGQGAGGVKTPAAAKKNKDGGAAAAEGEDDEEATAVKATAADIAAVSPSKGLKWAAYGLMLMMLMGIFLPALEFVFPSAKTAAPTRGKPAPKKNKKKNTFRDDEAEASAAQPKEEEL